MQDRGFPVYHCYVNLFNPILQHYDYRVPPENKSYVTLRKLHSLSASIDFENLPLSNAISFIAFNNWPCTNSGTQFFADIPVVSPSPLSPWGLGNVWAVNLLSFQIQKRAEDGAWTTLGIVSPVKLNGVVTPLPVLLDTGMHSVCHADEQIHLILV